MISDATCATVSKNSGRDFLVSMLETEPQRVMGHEAQIPIELLHTSDDELAERIAIARARLGERCVVLGHHYQRDEVIRFTDVRGDSYKLSRWAAERPEAEFIVFCGVHFMAETADILSAPDQRVILPNLAAGCSMADMATLEDVEQCWLELTDVVGDSVTPITYVNSAASLKSFVGRHGGVVCTSSNAPKALRWGFDLADRILFFPDQHLGRNSAHAMGVPLDEMVVWDPREERGGNSPEALRKARVILWKGWCSTHQRFSVAQVDKARAEHPGIHVIVHPECRLEVVEAADSYGSTEYILDTITRAPAGSSFAVGTEINLVHRIASEQPDKLVFCLDPVVCPCSTMYRIHPAYLCWVLEGLVEGTVINQISVDEETAEWARVALRRMLDL